MKTLILAASIALAFSSPAFAQDNPTPPATPADQAAPTDSQDAQTAPPPVAKAKKHHRARHVVASANTTAYDNANMRLSGNEPRIVAYQGSPNFKAYPPVDPGHVPGDPPVINHDADRAGSPTPTHTTITVPPPGH
jgi:hypothetical protein